MNREGFHRTDEDGVVARPVLALQAAFQGSVVLLKNRIAAVAEAPLANSRPISASDGKCAGDVGLVFGQDVDGKPATFDQAAV